MCSCLRIIDDVQYVLWCDPALMHFGSDTLCWILFWCGCGIVVQTFLSGTMSTNSSTKKQQPVDHGPATTFVPDPFVKDLVTVPRSTEYHGVVVTTMWPPPQRLMDMYSNKIMPEIQKCFDPADLPSAADEQSSAKVDVPVYLYPAESLHVTIATLSPIVKRDPDTDIQYYHTLNKKWSHILEAASKHSDWPNKVLQLEYDNAQIGSKAGIILWKETTGGLAKMRECIARQAELDGLKIRNVPPIIHSTFLRFQSMPSSHGDVVQERFSSIVKPKLKYIFSLSPPIEASWAKMICEWTPFMHTPDDDDHVLSTVSIPQI